MNFFKCHATPAGVAIATLFGIGGWGAAFSGGAQTAEPAGQVKAGIEANTKGEVVVDSVRPTPIEGLFEVTTKSMDLFYVDRTGRYGLIDGRMVDMRDRKDLTMGRINELRNIDFKKLPLHLAIKTGNGSRVLAVFEDPTCPVCRPLHKFIAQIPDTTVYHFPYPVVTKEALPITATAWCAPNRAEPRRDVGARHAGRTGVTCAQANVRHHRPRADRQGRRRVERQRHAHGVPGQWPAPARRGAAGSVHRSARRVGEVQCIGDQTMSGAPRGLPVSLRWSPVHAFAILATLSGSPALAADPSAPADLVAVYQGSPPTPQAAANASQAIRMTWADLRDTKLPDVAALARLWKDKLASAKSKWRSPGQLGASSGKPLPAFTLSHTFAWANPPVLVSILFDLYDCELSGNGQGADLFARCPMRVVTGGPGAVRLKDIAGVCYLYVPPIAKPGDGPDPAKNFTSLTLDASRTLRLRVVQFGRPVPACNGDYARRRPAQTRLSWESVYG